MSGNGNAPMAKLTFDASQYMAALEKLGQDFAPAAKAAIYDAAGIVAAEITSEIQDLPSVADYQRGKPGDLIDGVTDVQRAGLLEGLGIAKMQDDGGMIHTRVGFDGYNATVTKKYPHGQPNAMIARAITSGTTFRAKNRFIARAMQRAKPRAEKTIADRMEAAIKKIMD